LLTRNKKFVRLFFQLKFDKVLILYIFQKVFDKYHMSIKIDIKQL
jgi:hypothetical protein